ncbi:hypothetical protein Glove_60g62 [Diversispora epigaea]|uniref:Uncharacterized protein n=1 Tax=Diversispora epigaea TaxID=1348612 RepID=A0A397JF70_9GLOM|nr:hypothetical protein Glove_60g62 [Diversispora epigaea]
MYNSTSSSHSEDEIDKGIICLFTNKSDPKELFKHDDEKSDDFVDRQIQRLSFDQLEILRGKVKSFENDYQNWLIFGMNVWFLNMNLMDILSLQKIINFYTFFLLLESANEIYELLSQEVSRLQELFESADEVYELLSQELYVKCDANGCWKDVP